MGFEYITINPPKHLEPFVRFFWIFEGGTAGTPYVYRSMADPCAELMFHYRGRFDEVSTDGRGTEQRVASFRSGIHAQTARHHRFTIAERFGIVGVYLYPYAVHELLGLPASELTDQMPDLASALGATGRELEERVFAAVDNETRVQVLSEFLSRRLTQRRSEDHPVRLLLKQLIDTGGCQRVADLTQRCNLSERQLERVFRRLSGFPPKTYLRILRFSAACDRYSAGTRLSLTDIALDCGYYDQAHFNHDFTAFSGYRPTDYFSGASEGIEWRDEVPPGS